ncbi:hypothetical protein H6P81_016589 [Aristolochia fimbriata]|uniref:Nuclear pore complex protein NUP1 n=1 Tax=Aristolochia fimbriata TaxID=158543 RepID=A0AAV7E953_ARIFI|nr:hypothetical protein H6P81_016589 [Aristolochia fimbriata]
METAAGGSYGGGGVGGKFRRRPARRAATPYDRPPPALRNPEVPGRNGGWLSKLVDPASRIIADSASKLFKSVFRKRLPPIPESNKEARQELPKPVLEKNSSRQQVEGNKNVKDPDDNKLVCDEINEFEQLLKHKTFTRDECNRITELLRSRTVDLAATDEKSRVADDHKNKTEPRTSQKLPNHVECERQEISAPENVLRTSGLLGRISTTDVGISAHHGVASPTEVAKEFMGSRTLRVSPTTLGLRSQALREDSTFQSIVPFRTPRSSNMSFTPRSSRLLPDNGYVTPLPRGRSAIYNMARSPYMKVHSAAALKGPDVTEDYHGGSYLLSGGKQALKRRSSFLDTDFGSVGPIRRIRQKSNLMTPSKSTSSPRILNGPLASDAQRLAGLDGPSNLLSTENGDGKMGHTAVPPQSSEMARKILQQLDKLVPSPKEKSSEQKLALAREKSPSKLTTDMLSGQALKSMERFESPKFQLFDNHSSGIDSLDPRNDVTEKCSKVEKNGPSKISLLGAKIVSGIGVAETVATSAKDTASSSRVPTATMLRSDPGQLRSKHAFHMSAPEDSLDMDEDNSNVKGPATNMSATEEEKLQVAQTKFKAVASETRDAYFVNSKNAATTVSQEAEKNEKALDIHHSVAGKDVGFAFPTVSSTASDLTSSIMDNKQPVLKDQQNGHSAFEFSNKDSSVTLRLSDTVIPKFTAASYSKAEKLDSKPVAAGYQSSVSDKTQETQKASKLFRLSESASSSALSSTAAVQPVFAFGASASSTQSNGVLSSSTSAVSIATTATLPVFGSMSANTTASTSNPSVAASSSIFKFASGISASSSPSLIPHTAVTSSTEVTDSVMKNKLASTFSEPSSASSPSTAVATSAFAFGASATSNAITATSSSSIQTQSFGTFGSTIPGSSFANQGASITQSVGSQLGSSSSPAFGLNASSSFGTTSSIFGSSITTAKPFGSGVSIEIKPPVSFASGSSFSVTSVSTSTSLFGSSSEPSSSAISAVGKFGLAQSAESTKPSTLFGSSQPSNSTTASFFGSSSQTAGSASSIFASSSQPTNSGSMFGSSSQPTSSGSMFGSSSQPTSSGSLYGSSSQTTSLAAGIVGSSSLPTNATSSIFGSSSRDASSTPSVFGTGSQPSTSTSNLFGSSPQPATSTSSVFGLSAQAASPTTGLFGSNSQPASSVFTFGSSSTSLSTGFSFGSSTVPSGSGPISFGSSSPTFGSSMAPTFTFNSSTSATSTNPFSSARPLFQTSNAPVSFGATSPSNDQMNVEDSMAEDTVQASTGQAVLPFGQPASAPSPFTFGSTPVQSGGQQVFQFGGQAAPQNPSSPFAAVSGNLEVAPGGSFSLGTSGTDKSNRKIVRVRRDKLRKK